MKTSRSLTTLLIGGALLALTAAGNWHCMAREPAATQVREATARAAQAAAADEDRTHSVLSIHPDRTGLLLNGRPFQVVGLRCSNALISDEKTRQLIDNLDRFASYGVNTISVFFQGSRFGDIKGYREDGSLDLAYARRMARIIEAADARGMVILVGCLYYGGSRARWESWGQVEAERAVAHTIRWLKENDYRNVFVDVNNEHMAKFDDAKLIAAGKAVDPRCVIGTSGRRTPPNADLSLHHGGVVPGKPYVESEGTMSGYWGAYSKRKGLYNYIHIGVYMEKQKKEAANRTSRFLAQGHGYMFASTWLQGIPPHHEPGGTGTADDPGVRWWLEHVRSIVGPYVAGGSVGQWDRFEALIENTKRKEDLRW